MSRAEMSQKDWDELDSETRFDILFEELADNADEMAETMRETLVQQKTTNILLSGVLAMVTHKDPRENLMLAEQEARDQLNRG